MGSDGIGCYIGTIPTVWIWVPDHVCDCCFVHEIKSLRGFLIVVICIVLRYYIVVNCLHTSYFGLVVWVYPYTLLCVLILHIFFSLLSTRHLPAIDLRLQLKGHLISNPRMSYIFQAIAAVMINFLIFSCPSLQTHTLDFSIMFNFGVAFLILSIKV